MAAKKAGCHQEERSDEGSAVAPESSTLQWA
jgi:hypothetical protein